MTLFLLFALLLGAGEAGAMEFAKDMPYVNVPLPQSPITGQVRDIKDANGGYVATVIYNGKAWIPMLPVSPCLAQMEAAMKAVAPLSVIAAEEGIVWNFTNKKVTSLELLIHPRKDEEITMVRELWHAAEACWRTP